MPTTINHQQTTIKKMEYSKLEVWMEARKLVNLLYDFSKLFPKEELFGLTNQMRAAISIPSNIAEGRLQKKQYIFFIYLEDHYMN